MIIHSPGQEQTRLIGSASQLQRLIGDIIGDNPSISDFEADRSCRIFIHVQIHPTLLHSPFSAVAKSKIAAIKIQIAISVNRPGYKNIPSHMQYIILGIYTIVRSDISAAGQNDETWSIEIGMELRGQCRRFRPRLVRRPYTRHRPGNGTEPRFKINIPVRGDGSPDGCRTVEHHLCPGLKVD